MTGQIFKLLYYNVPWVTFFKKCSRNPAIVCTCMWCSFSTYVFSHFSHVLFFKKLSLGDLSQNLFLDFCFIKVIAVMIVGVVTDFEMTFAGGLFKIAWKANYFLFKVSILQTKGLSNIKASDRGPSLPSCWYLRSLLVVNETYLSQRHFNVCAFVRASLESCQEQNFYT